MDRQIDIDTYIFTVRSDETLNINYLMNFIKN